MKISLKKQLFRFSLAGSLFLGAVSLVIGLGIYAFVLAGQYISLAFNLSRTTLYAINEVMDMQPLVDCVRLRNGERGCHS